MTKRQSGKRSFFARFTVLCGVLVAWSGQFMAVDSTGAADPSRPEAAVHDPLHSFHLGLGALPLMSDAQTRSISAENPTGEKGMGARAIPDPDNPDLPHSHLAVHLGQGWKVRPFLRVPASETVTLMNVDGPGIVQHIWLVSGEWGVHGRSCVLRFYWDQEETPSVEVPVTDFFAVGHDLFAPVNSLPVVVNPSSALNCYWPMPFRRHARITFTNESQTDIDVLAYQITYALTPLPENCGYFHAQWRRTSAAQQNPYVILDGVRGKGRYVGTFLALTQTWDGWFGEGEVKFYLDGDTDYPTICGTGTEDYFLGSYGFPRTYSTPFVGVPLKQDAKSPDDPSGSAGTKWSMYRWHIMDAINFQQDFKVTLQVIGVGPDPGWSRRVDDLATVAYWYQTEPHAPFPPLPDLKHRVQKVPTPAPFQRPDQTEQSPPR